MSSYAYDSLLLIGFGGPTPGCCKKYDLCSGEAFCFVERIVGTALSDVERVQTVVSHYMALGGYSPFNELTFKQGAALKSALNQKGVDVPIYAGMRNWTPYLHETLAEMIENGHRNALGIIMSAYQTRASWERYQNDVNQALEKLNGERPTVSYLEEQWFSHSGFIEAIVGRIQAACADMEAERFKQAALIFTAHAIPEPAARRSPYTRQFEQTASTAAAMLGKGYELAYQSAPDNPTVPWTGPDINDLLREKAQAGAKDVILASIGFLCDHVEVLYDLDIEARATAEACGLNLIRAGTVGDHPAFIEMLADLVLDAFHADGKDSREPEKQGLGIGG